MDREFSARHEVGKLSDSPFGWAAQRRDAHMIAGARSHHHVGAPFFQPRQQIGDALVRVGAVGVGNAEDVVAGVTYACLDGGAVAAVGVVT